MVKYLLLLLSFMQLPVYAQNVPITSELIQRLKATEAVNMDQVIANLNLKGTKRRGFTSLNPYRPYTRVSQSEIDLPGPINGQTGYWKHKDGTVTFPHQQVVYEWFNKLPKDVRDSEVCAFKFIDKKKTQYQLKSFASKAQALSSGYIVTHQFHCGACSSLKDLAMYLEKRNMVNDSRRCAKRLSPLKSKKCHQKKIGFSNYCAEVWAYNANATRKNCMKTCVKEYGLINLLRGIYPDTYVNADGTLKPCILCDELKSGGGFHYMSGRTRRSSGIISAINRGDEEVYPLDYQTYYQEFDL
jgi:hypothetical protein